MNLFNIFSTRETDDLLLGMHKVGLRSNLESVDFFLDESLGKLNIILNRKNLRESLSQDEEINYGVMRVKIEKMIEELKSMNKTLE